MVRGSCRRANRRPPRVHINPTLNGVNKHGAELVAKGLG